MFTKTTLFLLSHWTRSTITLRLTPHSHIPRVRKATARASSSNMVCPHRTPHSPPCARASPQLWWALPCNTYSTSSRFSCLYPVSCISSDFLHIHLLSTFCFVHMPTLSHLLPNMSQDRLTLVDVPALSITLVQFSLDNSLPRTAFLPNYVQPLRRF